MKIAILARYILETHPEDRLDPWTAYWKTISGNVMLAAKVIVRGHNVPTSVDHQDLAQATLADLRDFVETLRARRPRASPADLELDIIKFGAVSLKNNLKDLVRTQARRSNLLSDDRTAARRSWLFGSRRYSPEVRAEILDWTAKVRATTRSDRMHAILTAIRYAVEQDLEVARADILTLAQAANAKVVSNDMHKFDRLTAKFEKAIERGSK